jgi:hypothetical protein
VGLVEHVSGEQVVIALHEVEYLVGDSESFLE